MDDIWLIVGLGNPGKKYAQHRHNAGFMVVEQIADRVGSAPFKTAAKYQSELTKATIAEHDAILVKPQTYMNLSGDAVSSLARFHRVPPERIVVIHDEVDLELGRLRIKKGGGDGGHNGLKSTTQALGSSDYLRIRVGVGRPQVGDVADYVLRPFAGEERAILTESLRQASDAVVCLVQRGLSATMNEYNGLNLAK